MASGWTGSLISPDQRIHSAATDAINHVGKQDTIHAITNPAHPDHQTALANHLLNDPTLGSRSTGSVNAPPGAPVGSASVFSNGNIPPAVQSAISNFNTNTQASLLSKIFSGGSGAVAPATGASNVSQAQDDYFRSQTALNNQRLAAANAPMAIQGKIDANLAANPARMGVMSLNPAMPGTYNATQDATLQSLYGQQATAKQAASGWVSPTY